MRQLDLVEHDQDHRPGGGVRSVGLGQQLGELPVVRGEVGGREHQQDLVALLYRALELDKARRSQADAQPLVTHPGLIQGRQQVALDPVAVRLGIRDEHVVPVAHRLAHRQNLTQPPHDSDSCRSSDAIR
jgi:hypothetical protein